MRPMTNCSHTGTLIFALLNDHFVMDENCGVLAARFSAGVSWQNPLFD